jgi:signal transduction histidine kinase
MIRKMDSSDQSPGQTQEERFRRLIDVGSALLSELDLEVVLMSVVEAARELASARYAALGVLDRDRTELERFIYLGIDDETKRAIGNLPRGRGVLGELIREPAPLRLRDVNEHPHAYGFPPGHPPMHSFLGVPITVRGETFGNLYMTEKQGAEEFDDDDEAAAKTLATWAGIAIENARLYTSVSEREAEVQRALRRAETSVDIARTVGGETDVGRVLDLIVKRGRALVDARALLVLLLRGEHLFVAARAGEVGREVAELTIPARGSVYGETMSDRAPRRLDGESGEYEHGLRERLGAESALVVPLVFRGYAVGALVAFDREAGGSGFDQEDTRLLQAFAASAATAVATAQSVEAERLQQQVEIGERERQRWAQELHDDALQGLAAIRISLATALQSEGPERAERIERAAAETAERLEGQIDELSRLVNDLRPASLERLGLAGALEALVEECASRGDLEIGAEIEIGEKLSGEEERIVYRLVQEALNNVLKHASAQSASVSTRLTDHQVRIEVEDDGCGFDSSSVATGHGLIGMRERIELLGGEIEIRSEPDQGTQISARVPLRLKG